MSNLSSTIKSIQDIMRKDAGVDGDAQRISQLGWMLFLKIFDEKENDWEITTDGYKSPIRRDLRWRNWAADAEGMTGDDLLHFVNNTLFPTLKSMTLRNNRDAARMVRDVFEDSYNYMKSGTLLRQVINKINTGIDLTSKADRHSFNDIYEQILKDLQSAGNAGEFYTPRAVTQFIVEMVNPRLGETVLDPACGTAGFLVNTIDHILANQKVKTLEQRETLQNSIRGVEKKPLPHMLATTNMILHGIEVPTVDHDNLLSRSWTEWTEKNRVNVIVTNPPFGGMEEDGVENNFPAQYRTRETANLFLTLVIHLLKDEGRCGLVLPDGFLFGEGVATRIKEVLLEKCNLHTIVRLPNGVFAPYTGIKTNLLFFTKGEPTKEVWYFEHPYPDGVKNYNKTKPISIKEFDLEKAWWNNRVENEHAWKVSAEELKKRNYNFDIKNPHRVLENDLKIEDIEPVYQASQNKINCICDEIITSIPKSAIEGRHAWNLLNQYFNTFFNNKEGIVKLKETILQLAVQGKLTHQDPTDEPATELLKRIKAEKEKLIKAGKLKKEKELPPIIEDEIPFELPEGWEWCRLVDIIELKSGDTISPELELATGDIPYLKVGDMNLPGNERQITVSSRYVNRTGKIEKSIIPNNSIIFPKRGGAIATNKKRIVKINVIVDLNVMAMTAPYSISFDYMYLWFEGIDLWKLNSGTSVPQINNKDIFPILFPLPPLAEQQRIVAKVQQLQQQLSQLEAQVQQSRKYAQQLLQSVLKEAFEQKGKVYDMNKEVSLAADV